MRNAAEEDPALLTFAAFRTAWVDFNANAPDNDDAAFQQAAYLPTRQAVLSFDGPLSPAAAIEALQLAIDANREGDDDLIEPLLNKLKGFLRQRFPAGQG
jgi:hypothetical protein